MSGYDLGGRGVAAEIARRAGQRAARFAAAHGRPVQVVAVGWSSDPTTDRFLAAKERAFHTRGLSFRGLVLDPADGTRAAVARVRALGRDPDVDGIFVQYPVPSALDARTLLEAVAPAKDIDGGGPRSVFPSATAEAVLRVLAAHGVPVRWVRAVVVGGQPAIAGSVKSLLAAAGARVEAVDEAVDEAEPSIGRPTGTDPRPGVTRDRLAGAELVVVASGRPGSVPVAALPAGAVVVDTGYYHGGGRGDVAWGDGAARVKARVPPVGGVGPVTVAVLMEHAADAAEARARRGGGDDGS